MAIVAEQKLPVHGDAQAGNVMAQRLVNQPIPVKVATVVPRLPIRLVTGVALVGIAALPRLVGLACLVVAVASASLL